jgi:biotin carboxyl carrier protein
VPDSPTDGRSPDRSAMDRAADHAAIERLTEDLLPALIAKLGATGLGELEVREGAWKVRLRRPAGAATTASGGRERRRERGEGRDHGAHGDRSGRPDRGGHGLDGTVPRDPSRAVATSPAVGIYRPRTDLAAGSRVHAGDRLGAVEMLGIPQEVAAPVDGIVGASLAESGDAVEYGQELLVIEATLGDASSNGHGPA